MAGSDAPGCTLTAEEQRTRRAEVRATIVPHVTAVTALVNGLQIEFAQRAGLRDLVREFIALERDCCSFLTFSLSPEKEQLSLQIHGPAEAAPVIEMFFRTASGERQ